MALPWIGRSPHSPYFIDADGADWTPIGQNDAITWVEFAGLLHRRDLGSVERHLAHLAAHGVTCLRLMLEYAEFGDGYFEQPAGVFNPVVVSAWDDLFRLAEAAGLRLLLTPLDTYFQWVRWDQHPYNVANGGPCPDRTQLMICPDTRALIKARLAFATERWGGSGALFAWDLWNEMHPVQGGDRPDCFTDYIDDVSPFLRALETRLHGRAHLQCVSVFGPELRWKPWLNEPIFRHRSLDFASTHLYEEGTIDDPADTVAPARAVAGLLAEALAEIDDGRPLLDSEHGPIHTFKDRGITLPDAFDDEYFRHIQWVHLACGGAGGGMRWPNRNPHVLTLGMRQAQRSLGGFVALIDWARFDRRRLTEGLACSDETVQVFGCGDGRQAVLYLLRSAPLDGAGRLRQADRRPISIKVPGLSAGPYEAAIWDPLSSRGTDVINVDCKMDSEFVIITNMCNELAVAIRSKR